ncbi:MAG: YncE family protein [Vicinamibacterales bacterium]|nr:YncE family protein [Vicinamibacterales bacterium]
MQVRFGILWSLAALSSIVVGVQAADPQYSKAGEIHIGGPGTFDYLNFDPATKRLYVTHGTEVVVIDTATKTIVGRIADTPGVHGIAIAPGNRGFTSNGRENRVSIVDLSTLATLSKVETGANPDAILYEPQRKEVYAFNHSGASATVIDAASGKVTATISLGGAVETGQSDAVLKRVYVNIEDQDNVDVIDTSNHTVIAHWPIAPASSGTGMAIDQTTHRLFVGGGKALVMMDAASGKVLSNVPICNGTDATWFDPGTKMVFASCSDGHITIAHEDSPTLLRPVGTIDTARGARTMTLDPATHTVYTAAQNFQPVDPNAAPPPAGGRARGPAPIPDTLHVLIYGAK